MEWQTVQILAIRVTGRGQTVRLKKDQLQQPVKVSKSLIISKYKYFCFIIYFAFIGFCYFDHFLLAQHT